MKDAIALIKDNGIFLIKESSIIETDPVGGPKQEKFLNAVIKVKTNFPPEELLELLLKIEHQLGRVRTIPNGPRTIDLDILLYDNITLKTATLSIPHPRMFTRDFVMRPLLEIAPEKSKEFNYARH